MLIYIYSIYIQHICIYSERERYSLLPVTYCLLMYIREAAGKEGIQKGLRALYRLLEAGQLNGAVQEKLVRLVTAVETRNIGEANKVRNSLREFVLNSRHPGHRRERSGFGCCGPCATLAGSAGIARIRADLWLHSTTSLFICRHRKRSEYQ